MPSRFGGAAFTLTLPYWEEPEAEESEEKSLPDKDEKTEKIEKSSEAPSDETAAKSCVGKND